MGIAAEALDDLQVPPRGRPDEAEQRSFAQGIEDMNDLDEDGRARFVVLMLNFFTTFENMHYQFSTGAMAPDVPP